MLDKGAGTVLSVRRELAASHGFVGQNLTCRAYWRLAGLYPVVLRRDYQ